MLHKLKYTQETREKGAFYASDFGKPLLDMYFAFKGVKPSNPPKWYDTLKWGAGKGVEDAILDIFKMSGIVQEDYNQKEHGRIEIEREGIRINGYIDAKMKDGTPIEVKSINNANRWDVMKYERNEPRSNYVGQLAVYIDALGMDNGNLFVSSIDGLHRFWFDAKKEGMTVKCGETVVDLDSEYKRWAKLWNDHVLTDTMPDIWEYRYKIPVEEVDWRSLSKTDISKARNGSKVIGDFQVSYSPYKDLIIELQGDTLGYTERELDYILDATKGYTTWEK